MKGQINVEPIAGLSGDTDAKETLAKSAVRELDEEIGLNINGEQYAASLFTKAIPSSPGMTDEQTNYYFVEQELTDGEVEDIKNHKPEGDGDIIQGQIWMPLKEFIASPTEALTKLAKETIPTKDMLSGLLLLMGHLQKTGRLKMELLDPKTRP